MGFLRLDYHEMVPAVFVLRAVCYDNIRIRLYDIDAVINEFKVGHETEILDILTEVREKRPHIIEIERFVCELRLGIPQRLGVKYLSQRRIQIVV